MSNNKFRLQGAFIALLAGIVLVALILVVGPIFGLSVKVEYKPVAPVSEAPIVEETPAFIPTNTDFPTLISPTVTLTLTESACNLGEVKSGGAGLYPDPNGDSNYLSLPTGTKLCLQAYQTRSYWVYVTARLQNNGVKQGWVYATKLAGFPDEVQEFPEDWAETANIPLWKGILPTSVAPIRPTTTATMAPVTQCVPFTIKRGGAYVYRTADGSSEMINNLNTGEGVCVQAHTGYWAFVTSLKGGLPVQGWVYVTKLVGFSDQTSLVAQNWYDEFNLPPYDSQNRPAPIAPATSTPVPTLDN